MRDVTWDAFPTGLPGPLNDAERMAKQILDKGRLEPEEVEDVLKLLPKDEASERKGGGLIFATDAFDVVV